MSRDGELIYLDITGHMSEDDVRDRICAYLRELGVKYRLNHAMNDIRCEDSYVIIETKSVGRLGSDPYRKGRGSRPGESPYGQVRRYVLEARQTDRLDENVEWLGIVTDGIRWWVWKWPKDYAALEPDCALWCGKRLTESSQMELSRILRRSVGKIGLPDKPETAFDQHFQCMSSGS